MNASMASWLKELEEENRYLKKMYAEERLKSELRKVYPVITIWTKWGDCLRECFGSSLHKKER